MWCSSVFVGFCQNNVKPSLQAVDQISLQMQTTKSGALPSWQLYGLQVTLTEGSSAAAQQSMDSSATCAIDLLMTVTSLCFEGQPPLEAQLKFVFTQCTQAHLQKQHWQTGTNF